MIAERIPATLELSAVALAFGLLVGLPVGAYSAVKQGSRLRIATKYTRAAREHFASKGVYVDLIKLYGSMELAPLVGLADAIVDLVSSGGTLRANKLVEVEDITPISSRLIVNQAAMKNRGAQLQPLIDAFSRASLDERTAGATGDDPDEAAARALLARRRANLI